MPPGDLVSKTDPLHAAGRHGSCGVGGIFDYRKQTMLAILYKVIIHDRTTRFWDAYLPEITILKSAFPGLGSEKFIVEPTSIVHDIEPSALWSRMISKWFKHATAQYGGNGDPDSPPPALMAALAAMEMEANKLLAAKDRTPISKEAQRELAMAKTAEEKAERERQNKIELADAAIELEALQDQLKLEETQAAIAEARKKLEVGTPRQNK